MRYLAFLVSLALVPRLYALPPTTAQVLATFGTYVDALRAQAGIPGVAAVVVDSQSVIWEQAFGQQDIGANIATRTDTPFHFDGLTGLLTAAMTLQCVEQGKVPLDTPLNVFTPSSPWGNLTIGQVLTHTSGTAGNLTFSYDISRYDALRYVVQTCKATMFRWAMRDLLEGNGMMDSVPGPDAASPSLPALESASPTEASRYNGVLARLATPYAVSASNVATPSQYSVTTLGGASGLISTALDFAKFDLALKQGTVLHADTLALAWSNPVNSNGQVLPHGLGWFVQSYNGEPLVWEFGAQTNAASSLVLTLPARGITLILLANSDRLAQPASLTAGDVTVSPFAKVFLGLVVK